MLPNVQPFALPPPPSGLLREASLFIDFDGTLVDLVERPDAVIVDDGLRDLLGALGALYDGRLAIVSGRSIAQLDAMLGPIAGRLAVSGSHGSEHRWQGLEVRPVRPLALDDATEALRRFAAGHPGAIVEAKSYGVALHYRLTPSVKDAAHDLARRLGETYGLALQSGKMMVELRVAGGDKGGAVRQMMRRPPMSGSRPICLGDDLTDETAFAAARELGGAGILVGPARVTEAVYGLPDVAAVRAWLAGAMKEQT
jgi:trehalose 6-phosphate phosphatase